jgi:hypothetical protein
MLAVERRWPGCRFLGWRTWDTAKASNGPKEWLESDDKVAAQRSQRGLVIASLLRRPADEHRGSVHGRAVAR